MSTVRKFSNPFRPGAGHYPPYLAGRGKEINEFKKLLEQEVILDNLVLTGLRGVGKTVLMDTFKPIAIKSGWLWVGTDLSETAMLSEQRLVLRLLIDLSVVTSSIEIGKKEAKAIGFQSPEKRPLMLDFDVLSAIYTSTRGMEIDKLKAVLEFVYNALKGQSFKGIVFAYDEAQNMADHAKREEFPLSLALDCFQSIQKKQIPFMLALAGLPPLFPKLVEARTFAERMFRVITLDRLDSPDTRDAILKPIEDSRCPVKLKDEGIQQITTASGGYPYFIQFICREAYDSYLQQMEAGREDPEVYLRDIVRKMDADFFAGRWAKATDRQRELLSVVADTHERDEEFTLQEVAEKSKILGGKPFSTSQISQMFTKLSELGLIYKNRHGKYAFAVPLLGEFIKRQRLG
jgi:hypothetical protein